MLPNVKILIQNGQLGGLLAFAEGVSGILGTGVAVSGKIGLADPRAVYSLDEAKALGITLADNPAMYRHVKEFYDMPGTKGQELNIMIVADTETPADLTDKTNANTASKLLNYAQGRIRLLTAFFTAPGGYSLVTTSGIDAEAYTAGVNAQALANEYAEAMMPLRVIIEGREFTGTAANLTAVNTLTQNRVAYLIGGTVNDKTCSVGLALGAVATLPVQRKISRVKNGGLPIATAFIGTAAVEVTSSLPGAVHDKGFITIRKFPTLGGYFFSSDRTAAAATDDYDKLARGRVIDKAHVLAYGVYVQEVDDDVVLISGGKLDPGVLKYLEAKIEDQIKLSMVASKECSGVTAFIDPAQNIGSTNKLKVVLNLRSVGYLGDIEVELGLTL